VRGMKNEQQRTGLRSFLLPLSVKDGLKNFVCLFTQSQVVEILAPRFVSQIPGSPSYLAGVLLYHGSLLPVIDLDLLCRQQLAPRVRYRQLVVVRTGVADPETGAPLKAVVAAKDRVRIATILGTDLEESFAQLKAPLALSESNLVRGCFQHEDDAVTLFDLGPVVQGIYAAT